MGFNLNLLQKRQYFGDYAKKKTLEIIDWNSQKTLFNKNLESIGFMCVFVFVLWCCVHIIKTG